MDRIYFNRNHLTNKLDCKIHRFCYADSTFSLTHNTNSSAITGDIPSHDNITQVFSHSYFLEQIKIYEGEIEHIKEYMNEFLDSIADAQELQRNKISRLIETTATNRQLAQIMGILEMNEDQLVLSIGT